MARTILTTETSKYVNWSIGQDTNDGSAALPWKRRQYAWERCQRDLDVAGQKLWIELAHNANDPFTDELYASGLMIGQGGAAYPEFRGNPSNPWDAVVQTNGHCFSFEHAVAAVQGVTVKSSTGVGIFAQWNDTWVGLGNNNYWNCSLAHIHAVKRSYIFSSGPYSIWGPAASHARGENADIFLSGGDSASVPIYGWPNFSDAFALALDNGGVRSHTITYGTAFGTRFIGRQNSNIGPGGNYFPGSVAGWVDTGSEIL